MARSKKYNKNLSKVQDMLDGTYGGKIQSGFIPENVHANREVGEKWTDSDGNEWEQMNGYRSKINRTPNVGMFSRRCKSCRKPCTKKFDVSTHNRMDRCYNCQMKFELDLKFMRVGENGNKCFFCQINFY